MSSRYSAICINHTPALVINEMDDYRSADEAMAEARHGPHRDCTPMVGRHSGALVEIGCPPDRYHPRHTKWVDTVWLHIAAEALLVDTSALQAALRRLHPCFNTGRLLRLRKLLVEHRPGGAISEEAGHE